MEKLFTFLSTFSEVLNVPKQGFSSVGCTSVQIISFVLRKQTSQTSNVERSYKTLVQIVFIFAKIIHRRRLTGSWIRLQPLFFINYLNLFTFLKQTPVRIIYPQILQIFAKTLRHLSRGVKEEWRIRVILEDSLDEV